MVVDDDDDDQNPYEFIWFLMMMMMMVMMIRIPMNLDGFLKYQNMFLLRYAAIYSTCGPQC